MPASMSQPHCLALLSLLIYIQRAPIGVCPSALRSRLLPAYLGAACRACLVLLSVMLLYPRPIICWLHTIMKQVVGYYLEIMWRMDSSKQTHKNRRMQEPTLTAVPSWDHASVQHERWLSFCLV